MASRRLGSLSAYCSSAACVSFSSASSASSSCSFAVRSACVSHVTIQGQPFIGRVAAYVD